MLEIRTFQGGYDNNLSYLLFEDNEAIIVDTSIDAKVILKFCQDNHLKVKFAIIMHSHFDHLVKYPGIKTIASDHFKGEADIKVKDNEVMEWKNHKLKFLHAPGHLYDSICVLIENKLFTSDTLFIDNCGRTDLEGADREEMQKTLARIKQLPDNTIIYPGHDYGNKPTATLKEQKETNHCLKY